MEENKIQDAEIERAEEKKAEGAIETSTENIKPKRKRDFYVELVLFLVLGFLIGIAIKTEAAKKITTGFDDYKMKIFQGGYDINKLQAEQAIKQAEEEQKQSEENPGDAGQLVDTEGGSCSAQ